MVKRRPRLSSAGRSRPPRRAGWLPPKVADPAAFGVSSGVISGMRASCDIVVRVDVAAAIAAGMVRACPKGRTGAGAGAGVGVGVRVERVGG